MPLPRGTTDVPGTILVGILWLNFVSLLIALFPVAIAILLFWEMNMPALWLLVAWLGALILKWLSKKIFHLDTENFFHSLSSYGNQTGYDQTKLPRQIPKMKK